MPRHNVRRYGPAIAAGLSMLVIAAAGVAAENNGPAKVEEIPGSELKRVTLTPKAAERLAIETVPVREEKVRRRVLLVGEVEEEPMVGLRAARKSDRSQTLDDDVTVRVFLDTNPSDDEDDLDEHDDEDDAEIVVPMRDDDDLDDDDDEPLRAKRVAMASADGQASDVLYYKLQSRAHGLRPGQQVGVKLVEPGSDTPKKVVPYSAVLYDEHGKAWVYTSPETLVFVRHPVTIEHIVGDKAVLQDGPDVDTKVVRVGAAELFGAELGVGH